MLRQTPQRSRDVHIGAGLWALRSTALHPASMPNLYRQAIDDARFVEALGFDSFWVAEHRFWYDGWCPQPVVLAAAVAAATETIAVGTAMHLLGQHDAARAARTARTVEQLFPGRIHLGVSLGYRDEEFDGLGLHRRDRARLLEAGLDEMLRAGAVPPAWVGGMAEAALRRAGSRGLSLLLPPTLDLRQLRRSIEVAHEAAHQAGTRVPRIGMLKDIWVGDESEGRDRLREHYREYVAAWWGLDEHGRADQDRIDKQVERSVSASAVGRADEVTSTLAALVDEGVDTLVLQIHMESTRDAYRDQLSAVAVEIVPVVRAAVRR